MFKNFPKVRPALPKDIADIYSTHYKLNRQGQTSATSVSQKMESWMHKQVARDVVNLQSLDKSTLELGAGTLNQLQYEPSSKAYDVVEPFVDLYKDSPLLSRVRNIYSDISEVPDNHRYDRITSVATLEHICNLPEVIAKSGLLLSENGVFRTSIPSEGTFVWTLGWKMTTGLEFRLKYGLDYGLLMKYEHVNTAKEIEEVLDFFFDKVRSKVFGLAKSVSLFQFFECHNPRIKRCADFIKQLS